MKTNTIMIGTSMPINKEGAIGHVSNYDLFVKLTSADSTVDSLPETLCIPPRNIICVTDYGKHRLVQYVDHTYKVNTIYVTDSVDDLISKTKSAANYYQNND